MNSQAIAIVVAERLGLAEAERHDAVTAQVDDALAALAHDLARPCVAERFEQLPIQRQAAIQRRDDEVEVVDTGPAHGPPL